MAVLYTALLEAFTYACGIMHSVHASMPIEHLHHSLSVLANEPSLYIRHGRFSVQYSLKPLFIILHIVESLLANSNLRLILKKPDPPVKQSIATKSSCHWLYTERACRVPSPPLYFGSSITGASTLTSFHKEDSPPRSSEADFMSCALHYDGLHRIYCTLMVQRAVIECHRPLLPGTL